MTIFTAIRPPPQPVPDPKPIIVPGRSLGDQVLVKIFVLIPFVALTAAVPIAWGWGLSWTDLGLAAGFYLVACLGVTVGYHRYFTHRAFKVKRGLIPWVADHRRHHAYSDRDGDPHSPWLYGTGPAALAKGFWHAHMGWLFERVNTNTERFAPDLLADRDLRIVDRLFPLWMTLSIGLPAALGGLITWSWWGALTALFWASLVRVSVLHHVVWSINSICHMIGQRPFASRDKAANFWPLAILSMGESWHNSHHADPTCAATASYPARSTSPPDSSGSSKSSTGSSMCAGPTPNDSPASPPGHDRHGHNAAPIEEKPVTATLQVLSPDRRPPAATLAPDPHPSAELLTVTAHPVPPGVVVIRVRGEVDLFTSPLLRNGILTQLYGPGRRLIVDLTAVGFFGAVGLTVLATVRHAALAVGVGLGLVANTRPVLLPLTITGMHTQFDIYPDLTQALSCVAGGPGRMTP